MSDRDLSYWLDLGKRAKACKGFEWKRGMVAVNDVNHTGLLQELCASSAELFLEGDFVAECEWVPDLRDPGTVGHCLAMMREAWGDHTVAAACECWPGADTWLAEVRAAEECRDRRFEAPTEAEAIIAAWEAAP